MLREMVWRARIRVNKGRRVCIGWERFIDELQDLCLEYRQEQKLQAESLEPDTHLHSLVRHGFKEGEGQIVSSCLHLLL